MGSNLGTNVALVGATFTFAAINRTVTSPSSNLCSTLLTDTYANNESTIVWIDVATTFSQQYNVTSKLELRKTQVTDWIILDASSLSHWETHHPNLIILSWSRAFIASSSLFICIRIMATTSRHGHICCLLYVFAQRTGQGKVRRVNKHQSHCFVDFGRSWEVQPSPQRAVLPSVLLHRVNLREHLRQICY